MKASPLQIVQAHYRTYVDANSGRERWQDYFVFGFLPIALAIGCWAAEVRLPVVASGALLTVAGLLSAYLFSVMLQVSERAMDWADKEPERGPDVSKHALFLEEIAANAGYAAIVSVVTAAMFVVAAVTKNEALIIFSALGLGLILHLVLVMSMVMSRVFALTRERLTRARTRGSRVTELPTGRRNTG